MNNLHPLIKDRVNIRLTVHPESLDMRQFSALLSTKPRKTKAKTKAHATACGTVYCLAGMILDESGVSMMYDEDGEAIGLGIGETPPSQQWIDFEISQLKGKVDPADVVIPAKARELFAKDHGDEAAQRLPFYGPDWAVETLGQLSRVKAQDVIGALQAIHRKYATMIIAAVVCAQGAVSFI